MLLAVDRLSRRKVHRKPPVGLDDTRTQPCTPQPALDSSQVGCVSGSCKETLIVSVNMKYIPLVFWLMTDDRYQRHDSLGSLVGCCRRHERCACVQFKGNVQ